MHAPTEQKPLLDRIQHKISLFMAKKVRAKRAKKRAQVAFGVGQSDRPVESVQKRQHGRRGSVGKLLIKR